MACAIREQQTVSREKMLYDVSFSFLGSALFLRFQGTFDLESTGLGGKSGTITHSFLSQISDTDSEQAFSAWHYERV